jgi:hypothetical protein
MRLVLMLLLCVATAGAWANDAARHSPAIKAQGATVTLEQVLNIDAHAGTNCTQQAALGLNVAFSPPMGGVYCSKMLRCCDEGNASCCANFERYCQPPDA